MAFGESLAGATRVVTSPRSHPGPGPTDWVRPLVFTQGPH